MEPSSPQAGRREEASVLVLRWQKRRSEAAEVEGTDIEITIHLSSRVRGAFGHKANQH
jgi:hypothetical protein